MLNKCCDVKRFTEDLPEINIVKELEKANKKVDVDTFSGHKFGEIISNSEISRDFKVDLIRGIRINKEENYCVIIADVNFKNKNNVYPDIFDLKDGLDKFTLYYVGEGKRNNQDIESSGNYFLKNSIINNSDIYVFQYINVNEYQYSGKFVLKSISKAMQPDENGKLREVILFKLKPKFI